MSRGRRLSRNLQPRQGHATLLQEQPNSLLLTPGNVFARDRLFYSCFVTSAGSRCPQAPHKHNEIIQQFPRQPQKSGKRLKQTQRQPLKDVSPGAANTNLSELISSELICTGRALLAAGRQSLALSSPKCVCGDSLGGCGSTAPVMDLPPVPPPASGEHCLCWELL